MSSTGNKWSCRNSLVNRDLGGRDFDELVLCASLGAFLDNPDLGNHFAKFTAKLKGLCLALLKNNTNHAFLAQNCRLLLAFLHRPTEAAPTMLVASWLVLDRLTSLLPTCQRISAFQAYPLKFRSGMRWVSCIT
jgi:hypothetical protein